MKRPTDLSYIVELINQSSANKLPILVRIYAGDVDNDLGVIAKSGADGVILVGNKMPIEAALVSSRNYRKQMVILAETNELSHERFIKITRIRRFRDFFKK